MIFVEEKYADLSSQTVSSLSHKATVEKRSQLQDTDMNCCESTWSPKLKESVTAYKVTHTHTHKHLLSPARKKKTHTPNQKYTHFHMHTLFKMQYSWSRRNQANERFINYLGSGALAHSPEGCCHSVCPNQDQTEGPKPLPYRHQGNNPTFQLNNKVGFFTTAYH